MRVRGSARVGTCETPWSASVRLCARACVHARAGFLHDELCLLWHNRLSFLPRGWLPDLSWIERSVVQTVAHSLNHLTFIECDTRCGIRLGIRQGIDGAFGIAFDWARVKSRPRR